MDYLRRASRVSRLERVRNDVIRERTNRKETVIEVIKRKQLSWYGHLMRMSEERIPVSVFKYLSLIHI